MSPQMGRTWFRVAFFITLMAGLLLFLQTPGTAEFVITAFTLGLGLLFMVVIIVIARRAK
ncbi:hypothetical protein FDZ74_03075 [bacterium]|nr:MAG: hypothetical protein FDZ74_03075 [bacterium]